MNSPDLRASDADREQVVHCLERHTSAGRLSLDEYADRVERALRARTQGELATVLADLPAEPAEPAEPGSADPAASHQLAVAFLIAGIALTMLTVLIVLLR
ncbi:DUF1707 SHOCT-like domain-containing protein [Micromonospora sp. NBC_01813]|uniref:DUF1707 SHOCT-like domain-containing protein n=1 Tax=Micromonospora sp. NBC_01813 TaxID=2975988 RepID=UPI002DD9CBA4|nr:DUF1707 domain-containing protein [Micromonospora sp. NBC_01813]WSA12220.1 DUF1707 domain-containing protein [Micromonospora sp. NBC_01813]